MPQGCTLTTDPVALGAFLDRHEARCSQHRAGKSEGVDMHCSVYYRCLSVSGSLWTVLGIPYSFVITSL